jgi:hypothetical protein
VLLAFWLFLLWLARRSGVAVYQEISPAALLGLAALAYVLGQGGRLVHEGGHAVVGWLGGCPPARVLFTPALAMTDWPGEREQPTRVRRPIAAAGSLVQAVLGAVLVIVSLTLGASWAPPVPEIVVLCGWLHVAAVANLLPVAGADGAHLFGSAWPIRPAWLGQVPALAPFVVVLVVVSHQYEDGFTVGYVRWLGSLEGMLTVGLSAAVVLPLMRRLLFPPGPSADRTA